MPQGHARDTLSCSTSHRRRPTERFWGPGVTRNGLFCGVYFGFGPQSRGRQPGASFPRFGGTPAAPGAERGCSAVMSGFPETLISYANEKDTQSRPGRQERV